MCLCVKGQSILLHVMLNAQCVLVRERLFGWNPMVFGLCAAPSLVRVSSMLHACSIWSFIDSLVVFSVSVCGGCGSVFQFLVDTRELRPGLKGPAPPP